VTRTGVAQRWQAVMFGWFRALMPREDRFFDMFEAHARILVQGADVLQHLLQGGPDVPRYCREIVDRENEADEVARDILLAVRRSFITPFDRSDIRDLIQSMDDAIDQMHQTAKAITLFELRDFDVRMRDMSGLVKEAAGLTVAAVPLLRSVGTNAGRLAQFAEEMTRLEGRADELHDEGIKALFLAHRRDDPMAFVVGSEIYGHLEKVVDRFEDVANEVHGIVIEHV
jgi:predicted phosphate transport protein (TIGR00153 family)